MRTLLQRRFLTTFFALTVVAATIGTASAQTLATIRDNGPSDNRIDIVVLGDGYTQPELAKYASDVDRFIDGFFAQEPFGEYQNFFNVHRIDIVSSESGADHPSRVPAVFKNTALNGTYDCGGIQRLTCVDMSKVNAVLSGIQPDQRDLVLVILNDTEYGGSGGAIAVASIHPDAVEVILHEMGHTLGLLADEYGGPPPPACNNSVEPPEVNVTRAAGGPIKWGNWIQPGTPLPTPGPSAGIPGLYQGGKYCDTGLYRPTYNSKMRSLFAPFEQINTERLIQRIYNFVSPIDAVTPQSPIVLTRTQSQVLRVTTPQPRTHAMEIVWTVDGQTTRGTELTLFGASLSVGTHTVQLLVSDGSGTDLVRATTAAMSERYEWTVTVTGGEASATATFVTADSTTQGSWRGVYGQDGAGVVGDNITTFFGTSFAQISATAQTWTWANPSTDIQALERTSGTGRVAATWFGDVINMDVNVFDGQPHRLALYVLDFDFHGRSQRVDVRDAGSGVLLGTQTVTDFTGGRYLVWQITGHVTVQITNLGGINAVVSGVFFDPPAPTQGGGGAAATFLNADATTRGSWKGVYGGDGGAVFGETSAYPSYAQVGITEAAPWTWVGTTTDVRALEKISAPTRIASTLFGEVMNIDINLTDGQPHRVALYSLDFDLHGRSQRVDVRDAISGRLLDSQTLNNFTDGRYLVWQLTGHVTVQVTRLAGINAVISGLFFGPATGAGGGGGNGGGNGGGTAAATFVARDSTTQGTWRGVYGSEGGRVAADDQFRAPSSALISVVNAGSWTWDNDSSDPRALQRPGGSGRFAATWFGDTFNIDVNVTDGQPHRLAVYCLDFDLHGRSQRIDVRDAVSGTLLDSQTVTDFTGGQYLVWQVKGHVILEVTRLGGINAIVSGVFVDPPAGGSSGSATAAFLSADATTQGSWRGVYGNDGGAVVGDTTSYPAYAQVGITGASPYTWIGTTTDLRGLQRISSDTRTASTLFGEVMTIDINLTDGQPHRFALYSLDFDFHGRGQRVDVRDAVNGTLLDSQTLTDFTGGRYLVWQLTGHVTVQITRLAGVNAVISGLFFGPGTQ